MPRTRFDKAVARDPLKEIVLGRKKAMQLTELQLAEKTHMSRGRLRGLLSKPSTEWMIGDALAFSKTLNIPISEMRELIARY